jgi:hypothetical protein
MRQTFGRVVVDDRGIRQRPFLLLFGPRFDFDWPRITGWAVAEAEPRSTVIGAVPVRVLELHTAGGVQAIPRAGTDEEFDTLIEQVRRRLPGRQKPSVLARTNPGRYS